MNTLNYMRLNDAADAIRIGKTIADGTVITAECGYIEGAPHPDVAAVESHAATSGWTKSWSDGVYHYELLVARQGVTVLTDANGDECGFRVNGSPHHNF